jgi:Flp pilus assembly protein TadG
MRRLRQDESGATAVIVAILLSVLVGMAAFVVDIGDGLWERRMLQNSADAAALAVAVDCAGGDCKDYDTTARDYSDANNWRGANVVSIVGPDGVSPPTPGGGEVTVTTRTGTREEAGRLVQWFSGVLGHTQGLATGASATAVWGTPGFASASPLTISICAWNRMTDTIGLPTPADIAKLPTVEEAAALVTGGDLGETVYYLSPTGGAQPPPEDAACYAPTGFYNDLSSGEKLPAAFGWLDSSGCVVPVTTDLDGGEWAPSEPGASAGNQVSCIKDIRLDDPPVAVFPIFVGEAEGNGVPDFQIISPAAFYLTGYRLPGDGPPTWSLGGPAPCSAPTSCIRGHWVRKLEEGAPIANPSSFGLSSVRLAD